MTDHAIVSRDVWLEARKSLLAREKEVTRLRDAVTAERMALPWVRVDKAYGFDTIDGRRSLGELFGGRSQLLIYHFMLGPDWDAGCPGCSLTGDHLDGSRPHLENHDVAIVAVSRAPLARIDAYKARMGWRFPWVSSHDSDFNHDFGVYFTPDDLASGHITYNYAQIPSDEGNDELPGLSAFFKDASGEVFHTYSAYARGVEPIVGVFALFDRAPLGRNEPAGAMDWLRRHDEYDQAAAPTACHAAS